jgi:hypothetical protein
MKFRGRLLTFFLLAAIVAVGCTSGGGAGDKAGGGGGPTMLRMANGYGSLDSEPAVAYFVERVEGALRRQHSRRGR